MGLFEKKHVKILTLIFALSFGVELAGAAQAPIRIKVLVPDKNAPVKPTSAVTPASTSLPASFPFSRWNGLPTVNVSLNESVSETLVFDTGLDKNLVSSDAGVRLNLPKLTGIVKAAFLDTTIEGSETRLDNIRFSSIQIRDIPAGIANLAARLSMKPHPDAPIGWLGTQFLSNYQVTFDFPQNTITLNTPASRFPKGRDSVVFPLEIQNGRPYIKVSIPGSKPFLALLDTGSPGSLLPASAIEKLKLKPIRIESISRYDVQIPAPPVKEPAKEGSVVGNKEGANSAKTDGLKENIKKEDVKQDVKGGLKVGMKDGQAALVVLPKLTIGKLEWKNQRIVYLTADSAPEFNRELAILGMDIISSYRVTLNFDRKQVQFTPLIQETKEP